MAPAVMRHAAAPATRAALAALAALVLAACYGDVTVGSPSATAARGPRMRTMQQLPVLDLRGPELDEYALFERVRTVYAAAGFADDAKQIDLELDDRAMIPYARDHAVVARHFLGDGPGPRDHLAVISHFVYGDRLPAAASIAFADYRAFMTALVCHEFAHALAMVRGKYQASQAWAEERRAMNFERGCLGDLVRARAIPADSLAASARFTRVLLAAAPPQVLADIPDDPAAQETAFDEAYAAVLAGMAQDPKHPHPDMAAVDRVLAMYSRYRASREAIAAPSIAAVADELGSR